MKRRLGNPIERAIAAAGSLTGNRFGLLVASSVVATSAIVVAALTGSGDRAALAALLSRSRAADSGAVASAPSASAAPSPGSGSPAISAAGDPPATAATAPSASPSAPAPPPSPKPAEPAPQSAPATPSTPKPEAGRIKHVFVISLAGSGYEAAFGTASQMPYLSGTLRPQGELLSGYSLLDPAALPNEIAAVSGQPPNAATKAECPTYAEFSAGAVPNAKGVVPGAGCVYPVEALTIADQLTSARFTWRAYVDGMEDEGRPANCVHPDPGEVVEPAPGGYAPSRNPFAYFHSLLDLGDCASDDVPIGDLTADLQKAGDTADYSYIAPTPCDSGTLGECAAGSVEGPAAADAFLSKWVPQILASPAYEKDGLLIVTFAGIDPSTAEAEAAKGEPLRVGALLVSRFLAPGSSDGAAYEPYALLRSTEELLGLERLGLAAASKTKTLAPALLGETGGD